MSTFRRCDRCGDEGYKYPHAEWIRVSNVTYPHPLGNGFPYPTIKGDYCSLECLRDEVIEAMQDTARLNEKYIHQKKMRKIP